MSLSRFIKFSLTGLAMLSASWALSACLVVDIIPNWRPVAQEINHNGSLDALNDSQPVVVEENGFRYVLFSGELTNNGDTELFLQKLSLTGTVTSLVRLTNNVGVDIEPRMVAGGNGFLYITWTYRFSDSSPYQVWFLRVRTSDLGIVQGPTLVSNAALSTSDSYASQLVYSPDLNQVSVVWASNAPTSTIYYNRVTTSAALSPTVVSQGTGCASAVRSQVQPRLTRSYPAGGYSQIAWVGFTGTDTDSVFWREFNNNNGQPSSNCIILSDLVTYAGLERELSLAMNPQSNRSYVGWAHTNDGSNDGDIYLRSVDFNRNVCNLINISGAITTTDDRMVNIAAGHTISNWVHLTWERWSVDAGNGAIQYNLVQDGANCAGDSVARTPITLTANVSLGTVPTTTADLDTPRIAVQTNALIARPTGSTSSLLAASPDQPPVPYHPAPVNPSLSHFGEGGVPAQANLAVASPAVEAPSVPHPTLDCAATPQHDKCTSPDNPANRVSPQGLAPVRPPRCGTGAADAVAVSFFDDTHNQMYAVLFQAGELLNGTTCQASAATGTNASLFALARNDYVYDVDDHAITMTPAGLPVVAWVGREPTSGVVFLANDEIYVTDALFGVALPLMVR